MLSRVRIGKFGLIAFIIQNLLRRRMQSLCISVDYSFAVFFN